MKQSFVDIKDLATSERAVLLVDMTKTLTKKKLTTLELTDALITTKSVKTVDEVIDAIKEFAVTEKPGGVVVCGVGIKELFGLLDVPTTNALASKDVYLRAYEAFEE